MSIEKHKVFLDSLEPEKELPEEMHGWRFSTDIDDFGIDDYAELDGAHFQNNFVAYLMERVRRAESRQIPELKEKVKELVRDAMDATDRYWHKPRADDDREMEQIRALCAIEGKP